MDVIGTREYGVAKPEEARGISALTERPLLTDEENIDAYSTAWKGIVSQLAPQVDPANFRNKQLPDNPTDLPQDEFAKQYAIGSWLQKRDPPTRFAMLKGLAEDIRGIRSGLKEINPELVRHQYLNFKNVPTEIAQEAKEISFAPQLISGRKKEATVAGRFDPNNSSVLFAANIDPRVMPVIKETKSEIETHEYAHLWTRLKGLVSQLGKESVEKLKDINSLSKYEPYNVDGREWIAKRQEDSIRTLKNSGEKITKNNYLRELKTNIDTVHEDKFGLLYE